MSNRRGLDGAILTHTLRRLRRRPGFTALAVATLALGLGGATALACLLPASRAVRVDPAIALRSE